MQSSRLVLAASALLLATGCGKDGGLESAASADRTAVWQRVASAADRDRIARWRSAWIAGLEKARTSSPQQVAAQGALLQPDMAIDDPLLPVGDYRCRVVKMGAQTKGLMDYIAYPYFTCRVSADAAGLHLAKLDGSQRPVGTLYPDEGRRMIFLGAMSLGDEARPLPYGRDTERDMAGIVERIAPKRWRIAFPYPRWESTIDIFELVPKG